MGTAQGSQVLGMLWPGAAAGAQNGPWKNVGGAGGGRVRQSSRRYNKSYPHQGCMSSARHLLHSLGFLIYRSLSIEREVIVSALPILPLTSQDIDWLGGSLLGKCTGCGWLRITQSRGWDWINQG